MSFYETPRIVVVVALSLPSEWQLNCWADTADVYSNSNSYLEAVSWAGNWCSQHHRRVLSAASASLSDDYHLQQQPVLYLQLPRPTTPAATIRWLQLHQQLLHSVYMLSTQFNWVFCSHANEESVVMVRDVLSHRGAWDNIVARPVWGENFLILLFNMAHCGLWCTLYFWATAGPPHVAGPGVTYASLPAPLDEPGNGWRLYCKLWINLSSCE